MLCTDWMSSAGVLGLLRSAEWKSGLTSSSTRKLKALHFFILSIKDFGVFFYFCSALDFIIRTAFAFDKVIRLCGANDFVFFCQKKALDDVEAVKQKQKYVPK
jgi:hypothetical protein